MPRLPQFDRSVVLDAATGVFWAHGYEASSVQMLLDAMGINRGSLYASFGDKASLFKESIETYSKNVDQLLGDNLLAINHPLAAIRHFFYEMLLYNEASASRYGCLLFNTIIELTDTCPLLAESSERQIEKIQQAMALRLEEAKRWRLLSDQFEVSVAAGVMIAMMAGFRTCYKMGASKESLRQMIDLGLDSLGL